MFDDKSTEEATRISGTQTTQCDGDGRIDVSLLFELLEGLGPIVLE
jgi:hypothetical protein